MITSDPLDTLFGSPGAARVLLYLQNYGEGYASEISRAYEMPKSQAHRELRKFEDIGLFVSRLRGRTRYYEWNPSSALARDLKPLLQRALEQVSESEREARYRARRRPRRTGKVTP